MITVCVLSPLAQLTLTRHGTSIPTDGSGRVLITDLNVVSTTNATDPNAILCSLPGNMDINSDWYVHPDSSTTDEQFRVQGIYMNDTNGWGRNRGPGIVRLWRTNTTALEGVFTCRFPSEPTVHLGIYYRSKLYYIIMHVFTVCISLLYYNKHISEACTAE